MSSLRDRQPHDFIFGWCLKRKKNFNESSTFFIIKRSVQLKARWWERERIANTHSSEVVEREWKIKQKKMKKRDLIVVEALRRKLKVNDMWAIFIQISYFFSHIFPLTYHALALKWLPTAHSVENEKPYRKKKISREWNFSEV